MKYIRKPGWRDFYNPLRGLNVARIIAMEEQADRGQFADIQWLWNQMPQTDATVSSAIEKRLAFIKSLDWEVIKDPKADPKLAEEQASILTYAYNRIENLQDAMKKIGYASFTGYTMLEKIKGYGPFVSRLDYLEPWYWVKEGVNGRWMFNPDATSWLSKGQMIDDRDLIIHAPGNPLFKSICRNFFAKQLALADWDVALENGANQSIFMIGPPGSHSEEKEAEYLAMAEAITSNMRGYIPNGGDVKSFDLAARSKMPFIDRIDYCDKQIVMTATNGQLTMLTESGSGTLAGNAHADTMMELNRSDAATITEVFQTAIDKPILHEFFPGQQPAAYFKLNQPKKAETKADIMNIVSNISWAGYRIKMAKLEELLEVDLEFIDPAADPANAQPVEAVAPVEAPVAEPLTNRSAQPNRPRPAQKAKS